MPLRGRRGGDHPEKAEQGKRTQAAQRQANGIPEGARRRRPKQPQVRDQTPIVSVDPANGAREQEGGAEEQQGL